MGGFGVSASEPTVSHGRGVSEPASPSPSYELVPQPALPRMALASPRPRC